MYYFNNLPLLTINRLIDPLPITVLAGWGAHVGKVALDDNHGCSIYHGKCDNEFTFHDHDHNHDY